MNWLLVRGLGREARHWGRFREKLANHPGVGSVLAIDTPGNGISFRDRSPLDLAEAVAAARAEFLNVRVEGTWGIVGISLGGMIAASWMAAYPDFQRCVLINSSSRSASPVTQRLKISAWPEIAKILTTVSPGDRERPILQLTVNNQAIVENYVQTWRSFAEERPCSIFNLLFQAVAAARFRLQPIPGEKVLIVRSLQDRLVDAMCSLELSKLLGARLETHPTAGHDLPLEDPDWLVDVVCEAW
jgi:pimeloyl-ACP methyl ester carboxylesterase